ncbi:unnamed protein product [Lepeophtheirus salmonis]|uniref:(salmon louse) hypothetical protein n=1 Tax=Lepeophtheirus salmonis TaxID=72036 RepID=A0A7R8CUM2_LEPSM|nr:unnamed protein product [Lepeophtheirus salmonis]CAF2937823.1 unnamed protein product [Lepeophtheirus salmonis]
MGWSDLYSLKYPPPPQCAARLVVKSRRKPDSTTRSGCFARVVIVAGVIAVAARVAVATLVEIRVCRWCLVAAGVIVIAASPNAEDFLVAGVPKDNPTVLAEVLVVALRKPNSNPEKCAVVGAGGIVVDVAVGVPPRFKKKEEETVAGASTRRNRIFTTEVDSGNQHPVWSANHVFTNVEENDFMASELEIMVWNYSNSQNHECLGKLVLESASLLNVNNQVQWYPLQNPNGYAYQTRQSYHQREPYSFQEFIPPVSSVQSSYTTRNPNIYSSNSSSCLYRKPYHIASPPKIPYTFPSRKSSSSILGSDILSNYYNTNSPSSSFHLNTHQRVSIQSRSCPQSRRTSAEYSQGSMTMISSRSSALLNDAISYSNLYSSIGSLRRRGSSNSSSKESLKTSQRRNNSACLLPVSSGRLHGRRKSDCGNRSIPIDTLGLDPKVRRNSSLDRGGDQDPYSGGSYNYDNNSRRNSRLY